MAVDRPDFSSPSGETEEISKSASAPSETQEWSPFVLPATIDTAGTDLRTADADPSSSVTGSLGAGDSTRDRTPRISGRVGPNPDLVLVPGYEIEGILGRGGMGVVYKARHLSLKRTVALKMILSGGHASNHELVRFRSEAEAIARLKHPNIVQIYEIGEQDGLPFFSLEFCPGGSLSDHLKGTPLPPKEATALVETLARAMHSAHRAGIVHRDLKPANILFQMDEANEAGTETDDGKSKPSLLTHFKAFVPKITDFGLAKKLNEADGPTVSGAIMGTPSYMSPEQAAGRTNEVTALSDVYALGAILYEILTGRPPFRGSSLLATLEQVRDVDPVRPSELQPKLPRDLETICLKCLQKDPSRRYASAEEMAEDLQRFGAGQPIRARATPAWEHVWKWSKRRPALAALSAAIVLITVVGFGLVSWQWLRAEEARAETAQRADAERTAKLNEAEARQLADRKRSEAQRISTSLLLEKGVALCERQQYAEGMLWLVRALELADPNAQDQVRSLRALLGNWGTHLCSINRVITHSSWINALAVSPDGRVLLGGNRDKTVRLWDAATGKELGEPIGYAPGISDVAFRPDGEAFAIAGADGKINLYQFGTRRLVLSFLAHPGGVSALSFSLDGKSILTSGSDKSARLWNAATGQTAGQALIHPAEVTCSALSSDSKVALTGSRDGKARLWDLTSGMAVAVFDHGSPVLGVSFSPDGKAVFTGSQDGRARFWNVATPGQSVGELPRHSGPVLGVAWSPDGQAVLTVAREGVVQLWDPVAKELLVEPLRHHGAITAALFAPDGKSVWTTSRDQMARQWLLHRQSLGNALQQSGAFSTIAFSPDSQILAATSGDAAVHLWDANTGKLLGPEIRHPEHIRGLTFSPDGRILLTRSDDGTARLWEVDTRRPRGATLRHAKEIRSAVFSPDGRTILTVSEDGAARLWRTADGEPMGMPMVHGDRVTFGGFAPDGRIVLTGSADQTARLWASATGEPLGPSLPHGGALHSGMVSIDGQYVLTVDTTGVSLWDVSVDRNEAKPRWHEPGAVAGVFSPDGTMVLTADKDQIARLREAATGAPMGEPMPHQAVVVEVAFRSDGRMVMTRGMNLIRLWDTATCRPICPPLRQGSIMGAFSWNGQTLLSADSNKGQLWDSASGKPLGASWSLAAPVRSAAYRPDGAAFLLGGSDGSARLFKIAPQLLKQPEHIKLWVEVNSGLNLDAAGAVLTLKDADWKQRYRQLLEKESNVE